MAQVRFSEDTKVPVEMDENQARLLFEEGAVLVLKDVPPKTEFGIDVNSWNTGDKFLGVKMIPPGLHFIYFSAVNTKFGDTAPRTGFFHWFRKGELLAMRWDQEKEILVDDVSETDRENMKMNLKSLDRYLGAYPYQSWNKWLMLSSRIRKEKMENLVPKSGFISSAAEMLTDSDFKDADSLPSMIPKPGTEINFTEISKQKYPEGASAADITKHNLDSSYQLETFIGKLDRVEDLLGELQFAFICFLVGQQYDSFSHWKYLVDMLCGCSDGLIKHSKLFQNFIADLYFQMEEIPDDFFVDIVSQNNFLVKCLTNLFENIRETEGVVKELRDKAVKFEQYASKKYCWCFSDDADDENAPVIVES